MVVTEDEDRTGNMETLRKAWAWLTDFGMTDEERAEDIW